MPLTETGESQVVLFNTNARATDQDGNFVTVIASQEAIQDKGWASVWQLASVKYDTGEFEVKEGVRIVRVTTGDWRNAVGTASGLTEVPNLATKPDAPN